MEEEATEVPPVVATKLLAPRAPQPCVARPRLLDALDGGVAGPITLLCAPAGAGKTALLTSWLAERGAPGPVAWLTLDAADDDPARLRGAILAALRAPIAGAPPDALPRAEPPLGERFLPALVNALAALPAPCVLVLDDLHELTGTDALAELSRLLHHAPPQLRTVLATRADPALALGRARVSGALTELRAGELAFTLAETRDLYARLGLPVAGEAIAALWSRTEGWAAGLRLAALSLHEHDDPARFVERFASGDHAVADYLMTEVLAHQPPEVVEFLLRTCIAEELDPALADALTGTHGSAATLERLERANAFVTGLEGPRQAYRYHQMFRDLLRARLHHVHPDELPRLHRRAAAWYADHDQVLPAVRHALQGDASERATELADAALQRARAHGELARTAATARELLALVEQLAGDEAAARAHRCVVLAHLGAAELWWERRALAAVHLEEALALAYEGDWPHVQLDCLGQLAIAAALEGRLSRTLTLSAEALALVERHGWRERPEAACALLAGALVAFQQCDLDAASALLEQAELAARGGEPPVQLAIALAHALVLAATDAAGAQRGRLKLLAARRIADDQLVPAALRCAVASCEARALLAAGDAGAARRALDHARGDDGGVPAHALLTRALLDLHDGAPRDALADVDGALAAAPHPALLVEAHLLRAVACHAVQEPAAAHAALEHGLACAETEPYRLAFVLGRPGMRELLAHHAREGTAYPDLLAELLDRTATAPAGASGHAPAEALTERERAVLRLLPTMLTHADIAAELYVSVNTVKTHVRGIYRKLGVARRADAVERARRLGLLSPGIVRTRAPQREVTPSG